ncbi:hypothetical protein C440_11896 [Haloferax mucosum ATCC BAA-1512]|uniref:Uncharacterized protein n=1 Tax=Haloferax mucosum ATCC BAA-1512 TaxID=662479 RepID=M0I8A7_9EURY|nr:hypothetical protein [Haloferax mucosum]ELZ93001.1 hypothetical protein C440_11896 [Haloferax mucosum ATCC BAA-1512]
MFDWFARRFTDPAAVAFVLGLRFLSYALYVALTAAAVGVRSRLTALNGGLAVVSVALTVLILHPDGLPLAASYADILIHVAVPAIAGYAVFSNPSEDRWVGFSLLLVTSLFFLTLLVVLYGEGP